eukprot:TRINITY_DN901_c0_g1_i5.p1 TRINITY_DN901_c0_g1~~TRINITY_DN901_c0_g1_i5.p1  ORF type:complete len:177 (-),score=39.62 TRINITY_DN901_c0_g1_i5:185-715(-)
MFFGSGPKPTTARYSIIKKALVVLAVCHVVLMALHFVGGWSSMFRGISELICGWFVVMAICTHHHCTLILYIFIVVMNSIGSFVKAGMSIQHDTLYGWDRYFFVVALISVACYVFGMCIALYAYKEFKFAQLYGAGPEFDIDVNKPDYLAKSEGISTVDLGLKNFEAFKGKGVVVG